MSDKLPPITIPVPNQLSIQHGGDTPAGVYEEVDIDARTITTYEAVKCPTVEDAAIQAADAIFDEFQVKTHSDDFNEHFAGINEIAAVIFPALRPLSEKIAELQAKVISVETAYIIMSGVAKGMSIERDKANAELDQLKAAVGAAGGL